MAGSGVSRIKKAEQQKKNGTNGDDSSETTPEPYEDAEPKTEPKTYEKDRKKSTVFTQKADKTSDYLKSIGVIK